MSNTPIASAMIPSEKTGRFWDSPEQFLLDAGREGELLIARVRVLLNLLLLLVPTANMLWAAPDERRQHAVGWIVTALAFVLSLGLWWVVSRDIRKSWVPLVSSIFDVTVVTAAQISFAFVAEPQVVVNSKITFDCYFLALAGTCLRYDKRIAVVAGAVCMLQYAATVGWVATHFSLNTPAGMMIYGRFQWSDQISRLILLAVATTLNVYIVSGIQYQKKLSNADALTGVFNRRFFDDYLRNEVARATRQHAALAVAMIDVDHFKEFNDRFGHAAGDRALCQVARALETAIRQSDLIARYGGEEFVLILRESSAADAMDRVEYIRRVIAAERMQVADGTSRYITVSIGVASWPSDGVTPAELLAEADRRLFDAKKAGRNMVIGPAPAEASLAVS